MSCTICNATIPEGSSTCPKCQSTPQTDTTPRKIPLWKRSKVFLGLTCVLGLWMISGIVGQFSSSSAVEIAVVNVSPGKDAEEERFLMYLLENQLDVIQLNYRQAPERAKPVIVEIKEYARAIVAHLDHYPVKTKSVQQSFKNVVELADGYEVMLVDLDLIDKRSKGPRGKASLEVGASSAALAYGSAKMLDTGDGAGLIVGGLAGLVHSWHDGLAKEAEFKAEADRTVGSFSTRLDQVRADAVVVADEVASKNAWDRSSLGFIRGQKPYGQEQFERTSKQMAPVLTELTRQRPLNPILQFHRIWLEDYLDGDSTSPQKHLEWTENFTHLARLAPSGAVYDKFRRGYMMRAGTMALKAAEQEGKGKKLGGSSNAAITSVPCWKTALSFDQSDSSGELRWGYAQSLALAGHLNEAREVLPQIRDHVCLNPDYHWLLARLASVNGEPDKALGHLKEAVEMGLNKIAEARASPDLENLRNAHADQVRSLLAVKFGWSVKYGMFNDDITITNQSTFPLTQLVFRPVISNNKGSFTPKQQLTLEKLDPGKSHTWVNCISVSSGGDSDTRKAELQCDQTIR